MYKFSEKDFRQLALRGISEYTAQEQLLHFQRGFPFIQLHAPALAGRGILQWHESDLQQHIDYYDQESVALQVIKFVPASGAATRMFKELFQWMETLQAGKTADTLCAEDPAARTFFEKLPSLAFWDDLKVYMAEHGYDAEACLVQQDYLPLLRYLLEDDGLGYAQLPKGLLKFHRYTHQARTPLEEHLVEGVHYGKDQQQQVKLHFTVSHEHREKFIEHAADVLEAYERAFGVQFQLSYSLQKPSTDTLAATNCNEPFRNTDGSLVFRPGGHGALIENLNELHDDIVFIKNVDNVVPDGLKATTIQYKKALGGLLLYMRRKVFGFMELLDTGTLTENQYHDLRQLAIQDLSIDPALLPATFDGDLERLKDLLDRPIRVCGMVKNLGEPGGGPFWVRHAQNGSLSLQIVESSQVNLQDAEQKQIFAQATYFNPVDLVCSLRNHKGEKFDLTRFVDPDTGFISLKSKDGKDLKAQELPGLWNGAMAHWITLFVEVPLITFNPVKTVMDLLRAEHLELEA